jgi:hypothetical protein
MGDDLRETMALVADGRHYHAAVPMPQMLTHGLRTTPNAVGDPRKVVRDPEARYIGGRLEETSLVPLGEARIRLNLEERLRC